MQDTTDPNAQDHTPEPGTPEYDEMMANKARQARGEGKQPDPQMPEGGLEKYWNPETGEYNWEAHAKELLFNANGRKTDNDPAEGEGEDAQSDANDGPLQISKEDQAAKDAVESAGLDVQELGRQIVTDGDISDEAKAALEEQGIPRELIDDYIEGVKARIQMTRQSALEYVGGEDAWQEINQWASQNLSETEKEEVNRLLAGPNWKLALDGLQARYQSAQAGSSEGNLHTGAKGGNNTPTGYTSRAQMKRDMSDPRYHTDPSFRNQVMLKMRYATWADDSA